MRLGDHRIDFGARVGSSQTETCIASDVPQRFPMGPSPGAFLLILVGSVV